MRTRTAALATLACVALLAAACSNPPSTVGGGDHQCTTGQQDPAGPAQMDVSYGPDIKHVLDIWPACTASAVGTIVYIHGGGYTGGSKQQGAHNNVKRLRDNGWVVVSIDYRLAPFQRWPAQPNDVQRAIDWWRSTGASAFAAPVAPLVGVGWSAGGHLAEWNNVQDAEVGFDASISVGGGTYWPDRAGSSTANNLFGLNPLPATLVNASSTTHLDAADPPLLHIHYDDDFYVPVGQAHTLDAAITASGNPAVHSVQLDSTCGHSLDCMRPSYVDPFLASVLAP